MRKGLLAVILGFIALLTGLARADNGAAENDDSRFTFHRAADRFVRLDGRSGEVSICSRRPAGWLCQLVPDERAALEGEIGRLQADNAALKKELLAHDLPLPAGIKPDARARTEEPRVSLPSDAELNRVMTFIEKIWRRLVEMIVNTQRDMMKKS